MLEIEIRAIVPVIGENVSVVSRAGGNHIYDEYENEAKKLVQILMLATPYPFTDSLIKELHHQRLNIQIGCNTASVVCEACEKRYLCLTGGVK